MASAKMLLLPDNAVAVLKVVVPSCSNSMLFIPNQTRDDLSSV